MKRTISFMLNGKPTSVEAEGGETLLYVLRERLHMTGTKEGCGVGECGACTVILDGKAVNSCLVPIGQAEGRAIYTIEDATDPEIERIRQAFVEQHAVQCGFCTPGMIMSAKALLMHNPNPTEQQIKEALSGNLCRCTGYANIVKAVESCAEPKAEI